MKFFIFFFFSIFHVFFAFHAISNIKTKIGEKKNSGGGGGGGGGGGALNFFFRKTILSYFTFYAIFNIKKIETPRLSVRPSITFSLLVKWEVVSPVVDRDSWNLYPLYPLIPCSDIVSQMWGWFGGGGGLCYFQHF